VFRVLALALVAALQMSSTFQPARVISSPFGGMPFGARAAGLVILEADVDERGRVTGVNTLRDLEPFGPVLRDAVKQWRFEPARHEGEAVPDPVLVVGLFRPAAVLFAAPPDPPPPPPSYAPTTIPFPLEVGIPAYPANAIGVAAVLVGVEIDADGRVTDAEIIGPTSGFDDSSLEAARRWEFRPAQYNRRNVPARSYLLFVFRQPVT
jgi:TonB family protein